MKKPMKRITYHHNKNLIPRNLRNVHGKLSAIFTKSSKIKLQQLHCFRTSFRQSSRKFSMLHFFPLTLFPQLNGIFFLCKLYQEKEHHNIELPDSKEIDNRNMTLFKLPKRSSEITEGKFIHCTCKVVNRTNCYIDFKTSKWLKN